jgi:hypothetical protein
MKKLFFNTILLTIILLGCDYTFDDTYYIENQTNKKVMLLYCLIDKNQIDTLFVLPYNKEMIYNAHSAGGRKQYIVPVKNIFETFKIFQDSILSTYDYFNDNNWKYKSTSETTATYIIIIDSNHFKY